MGGMWGGRLLLVAAVIAGCGAGADESTDTPPALGTPAVDGSAGAGGGIVGGAGGAGGGSAPDPFAAAPTCTSGSTWTRHNHGSAEMNPGLACITCHTTMQGPDLTIGGTVYATAHEPDLC